ncbi:hypothetical protein [Streptomyces collinus]|uniref:hypothetical protein n=1 Tax=Streptomyces collinus TaxID=42684 RepID=UPI0029421552|nr:hypothetical protein [Streptomyces collinus]
MSEWFDVVDALVASRLSLPTPDERRRLRQAHALTLDEVAATRGVRRATAGDWWVVPHGVPAAGRGVRWRPAARGHCAPHALLRWI